MILEYISSLSNAYFCFRFGLGLGLGLGVHGLYSYTLLKYFGANRVTEIVTFE